MTGPYVLYGADVSYYAAKIRACLVHKGLPFVERLATRALFSWDQWMLQRLPDATAGAPPTAATVIADTLERCGAPPLATVNLRARVARRAFRVVRASV